VSEGLGPKQRVMSTFLTLPLPIVTSELYHTTSARIMSPFANRKKTTKSTPPLKKNAMCPLSAA
jgi:hypothetical protein